MKIVYDRDEDIAATTKRHPARTHHRLAVDASGEYRDRRRRRDGRRRVSDAVAGRAIARRAARGGAVSLPGRARARPCGRDEPSAARSVSRLRCAADDVRVRTPDAEARDRARRRSARARKRLALRSGDTTATGQLLGFSVGTDEVLAAIEVSRAPRHARRHRQNGAPVRRGRGVVSLFTARATREVATRAHGARDHRGDRGRPLRGGSS